MPAAGRTRAEEVRWWAGSAMWREERGELLVRATIGLGAWASGELEGSVDGEELASGAEDARGERGELGERESRMRG